MELTRSALPDSTPVLAVAGEIDIANAPLLREHLTELIDATDADVVVDLNGVEFMDSSGLGTLVVGLKRMRDRGVGRELRLACRKPSVLRLLEIAGVTRLFVIDSS